MKLPTLGVWRRAPAGTSGGNLEQLRRLVHADGAWYVTGDGQTAGSTGAVAPWTRLEDPIRRCATTRIPDLTDSAILVPDPGAGAVLVLVRCRRKSFRRQDLSRAIAWLHQHRPDGAAEPLIVGLRTAPHL
jgi:hypothetical protein